MTKEDDKARLYRRIAGVNPRLVLERMRVFGFWPAHRDLPPDPPDEAKERTAIENELLSLARSGSLDEASVAKALRLERARRWEESKKRRLEKKKLREARAAEKRAAWRQRKRGLITHVGEGLSAGLEHAVSDADKLEAEKLPVLHTAADLAVALGLDLGRLRWLTFHRSGAALVHYRRYSIPKKTGGMRGISAPKPALAKAQRWIFERIVGQLRVEPEAHGFVPSRSIVSNATPHVGRHVVINLDLEEFFPSITWRRTKGLFVSLGYSEQVSVLLASLTTEPPRVEANLDGKLLHVAIGARRLPQGACTSPAITNVLCRALDRRLAGLAKSFGFAYTRYADDLTFSSDASEKVGALLTFIRRIITDEGFTEHQKKTRVMRRGRRQEVTGVVVNAKPSVAREEVRELRAVLTNAARHGFESQNRKNHPAFVEHLRGRIAFVAMVDPLRGERLRALFERALER